MKPKSEKENCDTSMELSSICSELEVYLVKLITYSITVTLSRVFTTHENA